MTTAQPASEATQLYNDLLERPFSDRQAAEQYAWRLYRHKQKDPQAVDARVALIEALQMAAKPVDAAREANEVYSLIPLMSPQVFRSYFRLTKDLGLWDLGIPLSWNVISDVDSCVALQLDNIPFEIGLGSGRLDILEEMIRVDLGEDTIKSVFSIMDQLGIRETFADHMSIVNSVLSGKFVDFEIVRNPSRVPTEFGFTYHVDKTVFDLREMENRLDDMLISFYREKGFDDIAPYLPYFNFSILPHEAASHRVAPE